MSVDILVRRIWELSKIQPNKLAVALKNDKITYSELINKACQIAVYMRDLGVRSGDRICFSAVSKPEMVAIYLAVQIVGGVSVFLDKNSTTRNMIEIYDESKARLLLTDKPIEGANCNLVSIKCIYNAKKDMSVNSDEMIKSLCYKPEHLSELLFTSGTTGKPKGVMLSYKSVYNILMNTIDGIGVGGDDVLLLPLPLNHSFALRVLRAVLYKGATLVLQNGFTFAKEVENNISTFGCNAMSCVPASYEVMKAQMQDSFSPILNKLKYIEFGAGSLSVGQRKEITAKLPNVIIYNTWGSSETGGVIFCNVSEIVKSDILCGALGKVTSNNVKVGFCDSSGNIIQSSREFPGRMILHGEMQMLGYWNNDELTAETLQNGWIITGDMAYIQDGYVFMLGRADDIINVGGEKVSPVEVENIAGQYENIAECACVAGDDPEGILGQVPVLYIVIKMGYSEDEFLKFLAKNMERYKIPQRIIRIDSLPRNRVGKIDRRELRNKLHYDASVALLNPVIENILSRRSTRKFTSAPIDDDILKMIMKCGYYAPNGHNLQTWRFIVLKKQSDIIRLKENTRVAAAAQKVNFYGWENPQVLILVTNDCRNMNGCQDASCATENIMLAAKSYGIGSVWLNPLMELRNVSPVKEILDEFGIPKRHTVWSCIALGYPAVSGLLLSKNEAVVKYID